MATYLDLKIDGSADMMRVVRAETSTNFSIKAVSAATGEG
jgi:hypothetical protein